MEVDSSQEASKTLLIYTYFLKNLHTILFSRVLSQGFLELDSLYSTPPLITHKTNHLPHKTHSLIPSYSK